MVKRKALSVFAILCLIIFSACFFLSGCSSSPTSVQMYENIESFLYGKLTDDNSFITSGLSSPNELKDFECYFDAETKQNADENYSVLTKIALDYVYNFYGEFYRNENYDYNHLNNSFNKMLEAFDQAQDKYEELSQVKDTEDRLIYNGFFVKYQSACKNFIDKLYDFVEEMNNIIIQDFKLFEIDFSNIGIIEANDFLQINKFLVANSCQKLLIDSFKGERFDGIKTNYDSHVIYTSVTNYLTELNEIQDIDYTAGKGESFVSLKSAIEKYYQESLMLDQVLSNFNMFDFIQQYQNSIEKYTQIDENATEHYDFIKKYFLFSEAVGGTKCATESLIDLLQNIYA